eukprot:1705067-Pyramimonas_sp.AAC.1
MDTSTVLGNFVDAVTWVKECLIQLPKWELAFRQGTFDDFSKQCKVIIKRICTAYNGATDEFKTD